MNSTSISKIVLYPHSFDKSVVEHALNSLLQIFACSNNQELNVWTEIVTKLDLFHYFEMFSEQYMTKFVIDLINIAHSRGKHNEISLLLDSKFTIFFSNILINHLIVEKSHDIIKIDLIILLDFLIDKPCFLSDEIIRKCLLIIITEELEDCSTFFKVELFDHFNSNKSDILRLCTNNELKWKLKWCFDIFHKLCNVSRIKISSFICI